MHISPHPKNKKSEDMQHTQEQDEHTQTAQKHARTHAKKYPSGDRGEETRGEATEES